MALFHWFKNRNQVPTEPVAYEPEESLSPDDHPLPDELADAGQGSAAEQAPAVAAPLSRSVPTGPRCPANEVREERRWFGEDEVRTLHSIEDESTLSREISKIDPRASREEILFRYTLSRAIYFREFNLPVLPGTAAQVMQLGRKSAADIHEYAHVIQSDPSLVSAIVRLSNSTMFSGVNQCGSLEQSIVRIGIAEVEKIAMLYTFNAKLFRVKGHDDLVERLIRHGVDVSFAAQAIARELRISAAEGFLGGLFHDVGKLVLLQVVSKVQTKLDWKASLDLIDSAFTAFHAQVGELLCRGWELPDSICEAVRWHHDTEQIADSPLNQSVYLGNQLAYALAIDSDQDDGAWIDGDPILLVSGFDVPRIRLLRDQVREELNVLRGEGIDRESLQDASTDGKSAS